MACFVRNLCSVKVDDIHVVPLFNSLWCAFIVEKQLREAGAAPSEAVPAIIEGLCPFGIFK